MNAASAGTPLPAATSAQRRRWHSHCFRKARTDYSPSLQPAGSPTMRHSRIWRSVVLALSALGVAGCGPDSPTAPSRQRAANPGLVTDLGTLLTRSVLKRQTSLVRDITVSATIGEQGGRLSIPDAGFQLTVPPGAVVEKTTFTVTALKGSLVAYEFGPHGIRFAKSLTARQDLNVTEWTERQVRPLVAGYFTERSALDDADGTALVSELISGVIAPLSNQFSFRIEHF